MPNGKGTLNCCYCVHYENSGKFFPSFGIQGFCRFHKKDIPLPKGEYMNRICCHFEANNDYWLDNPGKFCPPARIFAWFGIDMKPGALYAFDHDDPKSIKETAVMKEPDSFIDESLKRVDE
jgi:hypothetical protein